MPSAVTCGQILACQLARDPREVGRARRITREALARWELGEHADVAQLIVSELATNAIRHGSGPVLLTLSRTAAALSIEVRGDSDGPGKTVRATLQVASC